MRFCIAAAQFECHAGGGCTCNHVVSSVDPPEHLFHQPHFRAGLEVADAFLQDCREHAPNLSLAGDVTLVQQVHHAGDALSFLDDEVHFQVKLAPNELSEKNRVFLKKSLRQLYQCITPCLKLFIL